MFGIHSFNAHNILKVLFVHVFTAIQSDYDR